MSRPGRRNDAPAARTRQPRGGRRALEHRARTVWSALGLTALGIPFPGSGWLFAGRRRTGLLILAVWLVVVVAAGWYATHPRKLLALAVDPTMLLLAAVALAVLVLAWITVLICTYRVVRPAVLQSWRQAAGRVGLGLLCLIVAAPLALGAWYSMVQRDLVSTVFADGASQTRPDMDPDNPWADKGRVNLLLLGGDGAVDREGVRTDSMIVASIDTSTGDTTLFSVPRNLMKAPFPKDSPLHDAYPYGFTGEGDPGEWMLNAVYRNVPAQHPHILGKSDNEGADALKLAMSGILGIDVDYYMLVNLKGFKEIVDAIGGVTVNINQPIPIGGNTDQGIPPEDYLQPGPDKHLNGFKALWYSRGRYGLDDYNRMERQRCMARAIIDEADPLNLLRRYRALAAAGKKIVRTDIPQRMLQPFVELALEIKDGDLSSVVFRPSEHFSPADPDFDWLHKSVQKAIEDSPKSAEPTHSNGEDAEGESESTPSAGDADDSESEKKSKKKEEQRTDPCEYHPVG